RLGLALASVALTALPLSADHTGTLGKPDGVPHPKHVVDKIQQGLIPAAAAGAHLMYYGGPVIQNVKVYQVLYGTGTYASGIASGGATTATKMGDFYKAVTNSAYMDWLSEYNTSSPAQSIGRGTFAGMIQIAPASANN